MAAVLISPTHLSTMATRRAPLSSNPNAANSPLRTSSASLLAYQGSKLSKARSHADMMREEAYGQPPPAKRQMVDHGIQRSMPSPTRPKPRNVVHRVYASKAAEQAPATKRVPQSAAFKPSEKEVDNIRAWQTQTRARFPKMVFYFESVSDDQRSKLSKQVTHLGAVSGLGIELLGLNGDTDRTRSVSKLSFPAKSPISSQRARSRLRRQSKTKTNQTCKGNS